MMKLWLTAIFSLVYTAPAGPSDGPLLPSKRSRSDSMELPPLASPSPLEDKDILYNIQPYLSTTEGRGVSKAMTEAFDGNDFRRGGGLKAMVEIERECGYEAAKSLFQYLEWSGRIRPVKSLIDGGYYSHGFIRHFPFFARQLTDQDIKCFQALDGLCGILDVEVEFKLNDESLLILHTLKDLEWKCSVKVSGAVAYAHTILAETSTLKAKVVALDLMFSEGGALSAFTGMSALRRLKMTNIGDTNSVHATERSELLVSFIDQLAPDSLEELHITGYMKPLDLMRLHRPSLRRLRLEDIELSVLPPVPHVELFRCLIPDDYSDIMRGIPQQMDTFSIDPHHFQYPGGFLKELGRKTVIENAAFEKATDDFFIDARSLTVGAIPKKLSPNVKELSIATEHELHLDQAMFSAMIKPVEKALQSLALKIPNSYISESILYTLPRTLKHLEIQSDCLIEADSVPDLSAVKISDDQQCLIETLEIAIEEMDEACGAIVRILRTCPLKQVDMHEFGSSTCLVEMLDVIHDVAWYPPEFSNLRTLDAKLRVLLKMQEMGMDFKIQLGLVFEDLPSELNVAHYRLLDQILRNGAKELRIETFTSARHSSLFAHLESLSVYSVPDEYNQDFKTFISSVKLKHLTLETETQLGEYPALESLETIFAVRENDVRHIPEIDVHGLELHDPPSEWKKLSLGYQDIDDAFLSGLLQRIPSDEFKLYQCTVKVQWSSLVKFLNSLRDLRSLSFEEVNFVIDDPKDRTVFQSFELENFAMTEVSINSESKDVLLSFISRVYAKSLTISALIEDNSEAHNIVRTPLVQETLQAVQLKTVKEIRWLSNEGVYPYNIIFKHIHSVVPRWTRIMLSTGYI